MDTPEDSYREQPDSTRGPTGDQEPSTREPKHRAGSRREGAVKQGSLASLLNSENNVTRSVGSQGQGTAAAGVLQGRAPEHLDRVHDGSARSRCGPPGLRRLDRLQRPQKRDGARRVAAAGVQLGGPGGSRRAARNGGSTPVDAAVRPAVAKLPATRNAQVRAKGRRPGTRLSTWIQSARSETGTVE